jgi:nicotinamidase-related amidase
MALIPRAESLLLLVDVQDGFYGPARDDVDRAELDRVVDVCAWVAGVAAAVGVPTVATEEDAARNGPTATRVAARLGDTAEVLPKPVFAAGDNPPILAAIERHARAVVVLAGLETDVCVAHSALSLLDRGFRVAAVSDALYSPGAAHAHGIARLQASGVELLSAKELFYDWTRTLADSRATLAAHPELARPPGFAL